MPEKSNKEAKRDLIAVFAWRTLSLTIFALGLVAIFLTIRFWAYGSSDDPNIYALSYFGIPLGALLAIPGVLCWLSADSKWLDFKADKKGASVF